MFVEPFNTAGSDLDDKAYMLSKTGISAGLLSTETAILQVRNPSGSGKTLRFGRITVGNSAAAFTALVTVYANPTVTSNGTVLAPAPLQLGNAAASAVNAYTSPTCSSFGSQILVVTASISPSSTLIELERLLTVPANNVLLFTVTPGILGASITLNTFYLEY